MWRFLTSLLVIALLSVALLVRPLEPAGLASEPHPAIGFDAALRLADSLRTADPAGVAPECASLLLTHGVRTPRVVVLLHGLTNCPAQCESLARLAYARGANVFVPRLPHHGLADRMTEDLARVEAGELARFTDRVLDAAHGLGEHVTVAGLSIGGVMAAWAGQERSDVDRAVVIAPMFAWARAPGPARTAALVRLGSLLPNTFVWWDDARREHLLGPRHVYPRFASHAVVATMVLGAAVRRDAERRPPAARSLVLVLVGGDIAADNAMARALAGAWRAHGARDVRVHEFDAALHLNHDIVDPEQVGGDPARTYPVLLDLLVPPADTTARAAPRGPDPPAGLSASAVVPAARP